MDAATSIPTPVPPPVPRIDMWYAGNAEQRRWTVLIRLILLIPQFVVLFFLEIALVIVAIIGWFAALFTGRLPLWAREFIGGVLRWSTRVIAYGFLLTDQYPPFALTDEPYPVRPIFPPPGPLNRVVVLFRVILVIPAAFFDAIVRYGLTIPLIVVTWFIVLIQGRMPASLYSAYSALVRYDIRVSGYFYMLTSEYAWGMLGDRDVHETGPGSVSLASYPPPAGAVGAAGADAPGAVPPGPYASQYSAYGSTQPPASAWGAAGSEPTSANEPDVPGEAATPEPGPGIGAEPPYGQPGQPYGQPPASPPVEPPSAQPVQPPPPPPPPAPLSAPPPSSWPPPAPNEGADVGSMPPPGPSERAPEVARSEEPGWARLVLGGAARSWLIFAIVWGSILYVGQAGVQAAFRNNTTSSVDQYNTVVTDFNATSTAVRRAGTQAQRCSTVQCVRPSHLAAADSLSKFANDVNAMDVPANASNSARSTVSDAHHLSSIFYDLAHSSNASEYQATVQRSNLSGVLNSYATHTQSLLNDLRSNL